MKLTEIPISAVILARNLGFGLGDDVRELPCSTPCSVLEAGRFPRPFNRAPRHDAVSAEKRGSVLRNGEQDTGRYIIEHVDMLDFVPRRRIELAYSLKHAFDDIGSRSGLENALHVVVGPMNKHLVLYTYRMSNV
jgi:hypothetical protein